MRFQVLALCVAGVLSFPMILDGPCAGAGVNWQRAAYWDDRYPTCWTSGAALRDILEYDGYRVLDADQLKVWMNARISDRADSVVVFCQDVAPDTVAESLSSNATLRKYLDAGGKIVWYADIPLFYQGHRDGTRTDWGGDGAVSVLGFNACDGPWDSDGPVVWTSEGRAWGLHTPWQSVRPRSGAGRVLARDPAGFAAAWVEHYVPGDDYRGFVRFFDRPGVPDFQDVRRLAEYPNVPAPLELNNPAERDEDIVAAFFYPWYGNPDTTGRWVHWDGDNTQPPRTWTSCYVPNYPSSAWNPAVQLYDSTDTHVLRWQDQAMARAGLDLAISSWWGIGTFEDQALAQAIRICKSVQWCIYYEEEVYGDPSVAQIHADLKSVLDRFGPTRNYAKLDGKWLVFVYGAGGSETAARWRQAKALLAADGYPVYLNAGSGTTGPTDANPWDAIHGYSPVIHYGLTDTLPDVDDSAWLAPGFWKTGESASLPRSLAAFAAACEEAVARREQARFFLIETWNEWHEGTQIESGRQIEPDPAGYRPAAYDYGDDFIDVVAHAAAQTHGWPSAGNRPTVPVVLGARDLIWEPRVLAEGNSECRIPAEDVRVGKRVRVPAAGTLTLYVRARARGDDLPRYWEWPMILIYVDGKVVARGPVPSASTVLLKATTSARKGLHTLEIGMDVLDAGAWSLLLTSLDVRLTVP